MSEEISRQNEIDNLIEDCSNSHSGEILNAYSLGVKHGIETYQSKPQKDTEELIEVQIFLLRQGYTRCDRPACNCGSYHKEIKQ